MFGKKEKEDDDALRQHIISTAESIYLDNGRYKGIESEIAEKAGVSKKTIRRLFEDEQNLFAACCHDYMDTFGQGSLLHKSFVFTVLNKTNDYNAGKK